jgi:hypothetical protein
MSEEALKQRLSRAIKAAKKCLDHPKGTCEVVILGNGAFHLEAIREKEIRKIRIVLDQISIGDENELHKLRLPSICTKEIWCKKQGIRGFDRKEIY